MADDQQPTGVFNFGTHTLTVSGDFQTTGGTVILPLQNWLCPECGRSFHKSFKGSDCPICRIPLERKVEANPYAPGRVD